MNLLLQISLQYEKLIFSYTVLIGAAVCYLFFLYLRITDEFKDYDVDVKYFPSRPLAAGIVTFAELKMLLFCVSTVLVLVNVIYSVAIVEFSFIFILFFLISKYFYLPHLISANRFLAAITQMPVYILLYYYVILLYTKNQGLPNFSFKYILIVIWFWIPLVIWEFARKTWAPEEEMKGYQTYSAMIGHQNATFLILLCVVSHNLILFIARHTWQITLGIGIGYAGLFIAFIVIALKFIINPTSENNKLKGYSEFYQLCSCILAIINSFLIGI